jgi:flagellar hook-associated protein 3 FlgL
MRIATANAHARTIETLQQRQQQLSLAQAQLTSGKRVARASDDPSAAARAERALATAARSDADQRALEASRNAMQQAEGALGGAVELLQRSRELLVAAGNGSYSDDERAKIGAELRSLRQQLFALANRGDGAGGYLFGGQGSAAPPFVDGIGGVAFVGSAGAAVVQAGDRLPMTIDGEATWLAARTGNGVFVTAPDAANGNGAWIDGGRVVDPSALTGDDYRIVFGAGGSTWSVLRNGAPTALVNQPYVAGQSIAFDGLAVTVNGTPAAGDAFDLTPSTPTLSVFAALDRAVAELGTANRSSAQVTQTVQTALRDVDAAVANLQGRRAAAGESLQHIDAVEGRLADTKLHAQTERSLAEDLDLVQALSDFRNQQTGYDAALKTYSMVQRLSLFDYL